MEKVKTGGHQPIRPTSLTWYITLVIVIAVTLVSVTSLVTNLFVVTRENEAQFNRKSAEYLSYLKESLEIPLWNFDTAATVKLGRMMMANDIVSSLSIKDSKDNLLFADSKADESDDVVLTENIEYHDTIVGVLKMQLSKRLYREQQKHIAINGLLTIIGLIISIYAVVTLLVRRFLKKPLANFYAGIDAISKGNYQHHRYSTPYIELEGVMNRFNQMARDIKSREDSLVENNRALLNEIEEREKVERLLRESEGRYRSLYDNIPVGVFRSTVNGKIINFNPALLQMLAIPENLTLNQIRATNYYKRSEDRQRMLAMISRGGGAVGFECELKKSNGEFIWVSITSRGIVDDSGQITFVDGIVEDITERKRSEVEKEKLNAQLLQAQKMEAVGHLAGGIAHDFNNMLSVVIGHSEMAMIDLDPDDALHSRLKTIHEAARRSADLVRQLLAFARKQTISPKVLDINHTISGMLTMLRRLIGEDIDLSWAPGQSPGKIRIDPSQIDQILANLMVNARDAIAGVGKVTIETQIVVFDEVYCAGHPGFLPGRYVLLAVSDSGSGMDKKTLAQIFDPFFTTKAVGKGTGLGLATVYGIVKQNDGFINVYSEPGRGTTFKLYLPVVDAPEEPAEARIKLEPETGGTGTVLMVEDDEAILELGQSILEKLGYTVLTAPTPDRAIEIAQENSGKIDLLVTDVVMPQMSGRELVLRLEEITPGLRCLYMSGYTANVIAHHGVLDPGVHFLQKPFSIREIATKVREVIEK